ncbi:hypothetical protein AVEN_266887-1 [Araneus ventricosus]|uniref:Uncharacterized protein n=1 Tax=Araneus ventricosus TaxID=182803 RepID=A0A4Y2I251_ARAVE|nr:hypothetical protein AVEN_266887-1 [Araneus ventricosus]
MDLPNCDSRVVLEGPPALMDFDECVTDLEICQFLTGAAKSIAFYQSISEAISLLVKDKKSTARPALLNNDKEAREKIALLQKQMSSIGFCPTVNCAIHTSNNARFNSKRSLSESEEELI